MRISDWSSDVCSSDLLTETSPVAAANPIMGINKAGSIGLPLPGTDILIVDRDKPMTGMPLGEVGEIAIMGPQVMLGYWKRDEATASTIVNGRLQIGRASCRERVSTDV